MYYVTKTRIRGYLLPIGSCHDLNAVMVTSLSCLFNTPSAKERLFLSVVSALLKSTPKSPFSFLNDDDSTLKTRMLAI